MTQLSQADWEAAVERVGVVAGCLVKQDDKYLLVQEAQASAYGLWNLPAGHVDKGEEIEAAAIREVKEETGFDVNLVKEIALIHEKAAKSVKHLFIAAITGGELMPQEGEILDVKWLSLEEVKALKNDGKLRAPWVWDLVQKSHSGEL